METRIDYASELNAEQFAAVQAPDGPVLIIAAAGTGKTRTLVYRVAWLVEQGIPPDNILLVTFTNKAAQEMLDRARTLVGPSVSGLWGGTFHHLANRILRRHAEALGYGTDYGIIDSDERVRLREGQQELGLSKDEAEAILRNRHQLMGRSRSPSAPRAAPRPETCPHCGKELVSRRAGD